MALFPGLPRLAGTRKVKPIWILLKRDSEWQWHQLGHMQVCTMLQTDNHTSTPPLRFLQAGRPSCRPTNSVKALKAKYHKQRWILTWLASCSEVSLVEAWRWTVVSCVWMRLFSSSSNVRSRSADFRSSWALVRASDNFTFFSCSSDFTCNITATIGPNKNRKWAS